MCVRGLVIFRKNIFLCLEHKRVETFIDGGMGSGGGMVGIVSIERGNQCGSNGTSWSLSVAILSEISEYQF
jgi:hypothetical protein